MGNVGSTWGEQYLCELSGVEGRLQRGNDILQSPGVSLKEEELGANENIRLAVLQVWCPLESPD